MADEMSNENPNALQVVHHVAHRTDGHYVAPALDLEAYRPHLAGMSLTREREDELLQTLWSMMTAFVDLGFGLDSVQNVFNGTAQNACKTGAGCATSEGTHSPSPSQELEVLETFRQVTADTHKQTHK